MGVSWVMSRIEWFLWALNEWKRLIQHGSYRSQQWRLEKNENKFLDNIFIDPFLCTGFLSPPVIEICETRCHLESNTWWKNFPKNRSLGLSHFYELEMISMNPRKNWFWVENGTPKIGKIGVLEAFFPHSWGPNFQKFSRSARGSLR